MVRGVFPPTILMDLWKILLLKELGRLPSYRILCTRRVLSTGRVLFTHMVIHRLWVEYCDPYLFCENLITYNIYISWIKAIKKPHVRPQKVENPTIFSSKMRRFVWIYIQISIPTFSLTINEKLEQKVV